MVVPFLPSSAFEISFQYSLCRVVLMVIMVPRRSVPWRMFQYSLCRVVLMVVAKPNPPPPRAGVSVLALSSRFDGLTACSHALLPTVCFSTRSVESF